MKRIIGIILVCACLIGLIGCTGEPENRPYDKEPKTGGATLADFGLYENGQLSDHADLTGSTISGTLDIRYEGPLDAENLVYQTWRGIQLTDSIEKVAEAYKDWGMPDDGFPELDGITNINEFLELVKQRSEGKDSINASLEYTWYCKPGTCEFTREPITENDVKYTVRFWFGKGAGDDIVLQNLRIERVGEHPEIKKEIETNQEPAQYQGEILENMSEEEFGLYRGNEPAETATATEQNPDASYQIDDRDKYNTLRGIEYLSSVEELCEAYGDFHLTRVSYAREVESLPQEQWEGLTLDEFAKQNPDLMKGSLTLEFGIQKQGDTWSVCTRDRRTQKEPVEDVTEYWMDVTTENGKVVEVYMWTSYLGERDLNALYAQIQEERGLTVSN